MFASILLHLAIPWLICSSTLQLNLLCMGPFTLLGVSVCFFIMVVTQPERFHVKRKDVWLHNCWVNLILEVVDDLCVHISHLCSHLFAVPSAFKAWSKDQVPDRLHAKHGAEEKAAGRVPGFPQRRACQVTCSRYNVGSCGHHFF